MMAGMIKDFFDRTYEAAQNKTIGLPFIVFVCAGNDGRGAITQIERIAAGYKWRKVQKHVRVVGTSIVCRSRSWNFLKKMEKPYLIWTIYSYAG